MSRTSSTIGALALLALIGAVVAWAVLSGDGSDETTAPSTPRAAGTPDRDPAHQGANATTQGAHHKPRLELSRRGHPIVWLRHGAEIPIRAAPGGKVVKTLRWRTPFGSRTVLAVFRHVGNWAAVPTPLLPNGELGWVKLDPSSLRAGWTRYTIDIDLSQRAAQLRRGDRVLRSFAVSVGAPGSSTPTGRFAITDTFRGNLNPAYGCCAVAITARQLHLPSGWLGGDRIAIHGTIGALGVAISHGCVRAANENVNALVNRAPLGSPVIIRQ
jgi:L,D-transpeptidase-like protein